MTSIVELKFVVSTINVHRKSEHQKQALVPSHPPTLFAFARASSGDRMDFKLSKKSVLC